MDPLTLFLAGLVGPVTLAVGVGIFMSRNYYAKVYRHLESETLSVLMSGIVALVVGIVMVQIHNRWDSLLAGIISFVGWASIGKGLLLIIVPKYVDKIGDFIADTPWFSYIGAFYAALGAYISYLAYLA